MTRICIEPNFILYFINLVAKYTRENGKHRVQMLPDIL